MHCHRSMFLKNTKWKLVRVFLHRCTCILKCTSAFLRPMGTAQIPKPVKNIEAFVRYGALVRLCIYTNRCRFAAYEHRTNTDTNYKSRCICVILRTGVFKSLYAPVCLRIQVHRYKNTHTGFHFVFFRNIDLWQCKYCDCFKFIIHQKSTHIITIFILIKFLLMDLNVMFRLICYIISKLLWFLKIYYSSKVDTYISYTNIHMN